MRKNACAASFAGCAPCKADGARGVPKEGGTPRSEGPYVGSPAYECRPEKYIFTTVKLKITHR